MFGLNLLFTAPAAQAHSHVFDFSREPLLGTFACSGSGFNPKANSYQTQP